MLLGTSEKLTNNKITSLHALFLLFLFREKSMIGICLPVVGTRSFCKHRMKGRRLTNKTKLKCILYNTHAIHPMASKRKLQPLEIHGLCVWVLGLDS